MLYRRNEIRRLTARYGKGYTYSAVTRMMKVARYYSDEETFATLSQTLTWSAEMMKRGGLIRAHARIWEKKKY